VEQGMLRWNGLFELAGLNLLFLATQIPPEQAGEDPPKVPAKDSAPRPPSEGLGAHSAHTAPPLSEAASGNEADLGDLRSESKRAGRQRDAEAATRIQAVQRGNAGRKQAKRKEAQESKRRKEAATTIQSAQRRQSAARVQREVQMQREEQAAAEEMQSRKEEEQLAATRIQATQRGRSAREQARRQAEERAAKRQEEETAACRIQAVQRGRTSRKQSESGPSAVRSDPPGEESTVVDQETAATKIQAVQRGRQGRLKVKDVQAQRRASASPLPDTPSDSAEETQGITQEAAATKIQAIQRGRQGRAKVKDARDRQVIEKEQEAAATTIQAVQRPPEDEVCQEAAATKIQAVQRGRQARARVRIFLEDTKGAEVITPGEDGGQRLKAEEVEELRANAIVPAKVEYTQDTAAVRIQAVQRGRKARADVREMQGGDQTRRSSDGKDSRRHGAAVTIQNAQRSRIARAEVQQRRELKSKNSTQEQAALKIQKVQRGHQVRRKRKV